MREILEPNNQSEFEVQAFIWSELKKLGINVRGEVKVPYPEPGDRRAVCRFDLAIFKFGKLAGIIEVKSNIIKHKKEGGWNATRQGTRYATFGVPIALIYGQKQAEFFIKSAVEAGEIIWPN